MKYKVRILPIACENLKRIEDYYYVKYGKEIAIKKIYQLIKFIERLEVSPDFSTNIADAWLKDMGMRTLNSDKYLIIFKIINNEIYIYQIVDNGIKK